MDFNKTTLRILLVEDSEHDRVAFHRALKKCPVPYDITEFIRAEEALDNLRDKGAAFDIVVADHGLPGMTGLDFCRAVIAENVPLPLVLLTGSGTEDIAVQAMKAGVHDYIIKDEYSRYLDLLPLNLLGAVKRYKEKFLRLQAEEKIRSQNEFLTTILESLSHPFYVIDAATYVIVQANSAAKLGNLKEKPTCYGMNHQRESPCRSPKDLCPLEEVKKTKRPVMVEHIHFDKEGKEKAVEVHAYPILGPDGEVTQMIEYSFDITERKKAEEALRQAKEKAEEATKLKDKFVSLVAHDLKEPLASLLGTLAFIRRDLDKAASEKTKTLMDMAVGSGEKMVHLIDDLLSVSRLKTGIIKPKSIFLDAYFVASKIMLNYRALASQKGVHLENRIPEKTRVYADPTLLYEAVQNLVSNAIKFCRQGDRIALSSSNENGPCIAVSDTGVGIKPEKLGRIFSYEEKTSTPGTLGEKGTGLGLPLCRDIVEGHHGTITVESTPDRGSVFYIHLPLVRPRVLIVDDSKNTRRILQEFLKEVDVETILAEDGKKAVELLENNPPHLVITDLMMPDMDGFELLRILKSAPETKSIPVIAVTADANIETRERAFRMGAEDFIVKPFVLEDLIPRVRKILV